MVSTTKKAITVAFTSPNQFFGGTTFILPFIRHMFPPRQKTPSYQAEMHTMLNLRLLMQEH